MRPSIEGEAAKDIAPSDATLEAQIDPEGANGIYYQFQIVSDPGLYQPELACPVESSPGPRCVGTHAASGLPVGFIRGGSEPTSVEIGLADAGMTLQPETTYHYRVLAAPAVRTEGTIEWQGPPVYGDDQVLRTSSSTKPIIEAESAAEIAARNATLEAQIDPGGLQTAYLFKLEAPSCPSIDLRDLCETAGGGVQLTSGFLRAGSTAKTVRIDIAKAWHPLSPGTSYAFSVAAVNSNGEVFGAQTEFETR